MLSTLADQVAMAIENARLFGEAQKALAKSRAVFEKYTQQEWSNFARQVKQTGFLFDGKQVSPINSNEERENVKKVSKTGSLSLEKEIVLDSHSYQTPRANDWRDRRTLEKRGAAVETGGDQHA